MAAPDSATAWSCSPEPPLTPICPHYFSVFFERYSPGKDHDPSMIRSMEYRRTAPRLGVVSEIFGRDIEGARRARLVLADPDQRSLSDESEGVFRRWHPLSTIRPHVPARGGRKPKPVGAAGTRATPSPGGLIAARRRHHPRRNPCACPPPLNQLPWDVAKDGSSGINWSPSPLRSLGPGCSR